MINVLMCAYKSGDVIDLALKQLIDCPEITRILIADGPTTDPAPSGQEIETPKIADVVKSMNSDKIIYEHTSNLKHRAVKNNHILPHVSKDCEWILVVDSDEIYHEDDLKKLVKFLKDGPEFDFYKISIVTLFKDFWHEIKIDHWTYRIYRWFPGCSKCPDGDELHQYVMCDKLMKKNKKENERKGAGLLSPDICKFYHLNALREGNKPKRCSIDPATEEVTWRGGGQVVKSKIYPLKKEDLPKSIRDLGRDTL